MAEEFDQKNSKNRNPKIFDLEIASAEEKLFAGEATSLSSVNSKGTFDILARHQDFISLIRDFVDVIDSEGKKHHFDINTAVLHCKGEKVKIFIGLEDF